MTPENLPKDVSDGSELIPSEVAARIEREGTQEEKRKELKNNTSSTTGGYVVDKEGLINNYPVTPPLTGSGSPTREEQKAYLIWGVIAATLVLSLILIAFGVS